MELILLKKIANLGNLGDRVKVRSGYGRNFLLPGGMATLATPANVAKFEARKAEIEAAATVELNAAQARAAALRELRVTIAAKVGSEGRLFGSVGTTDIAEACVRAGQPVERAEVRLPQGPLRAVGDHVVTLHLHSDVEIELPVVIIAEE
ncbi:MAG: 50S ribosomal protein L9 [Gammaproteobacteria bacterium]|nr:MAG: 50S ribosomal protein L9 [Gammaproteobacteria bacterium]